MRQTNLKQASTLAALLLLTALSTRAEIALNNGSNVAFLGDSITAQGWTSSNGYVRLVVAGLDANGVKIVPVPAGVGGNTSKDMLARLKRDVLDKKPDWVTISCGMNDVIHGANGVPLDLYKISIAEIVNQCQAANIKVVLLSTTTAGKWDSDNSKKLGEYSSFLRELAREKKCLFVNLFPAFVETLKSNDTLRALTGDGVHMTPEGNILIARTMLRSLGCSDVQIEKAYQSWLDLPHSGDLSARVDVVLNKRFFRTASVLTLREREKLLAGAQAAKKPTLMHWSKDLLASLMKKKVKPTGPFESLDAIFEQGKDKQVQGELQVEFEDEIRAIVGAK